ncbi:MAG TPA: MaoC family dehydratase [Pseudomonadales bacterium]
MMLSFNAVNIGDTLPELPIDVSAKLIVGGAIASRDYQDVHHDKARAIELGSKDIFMNILTTNGLVGRYITDWTGPGGELKSVNIRLGVPNYVGDHMTLSGEVKDKRVEGDEQLIEVAVTGKNSLGNHVTGTVLVALYEGDAV